MQNSNQNQNRIYYVRNNNQSNNSQNQNQYPNQHQQYQQNNRIQNQNNVINPILQANQQGAYLQEVTAFATYVKFQKLIPNRLTIKDCIEIISVADRLAIARLDALKTWQVYKGSVVISAHFLLNVLITHKLVLANKVRISHYSSLEPFCLIYLTDREELAAQAWHKEKTNTSIWKNSPTQAVEELALVRFLRTTFPTIMMGIIAPVEVPASFFANFKAITTSFTVGLTVGIYQKVKNFVNSCFVSHSISSAGSVSCVNLLKEEQVNKTNKLVETDKLIGTENEKDEDFFLDLDELEVRHHQKVKPTTHLN